MRYRCYEGIGDQAEDERLDDAEVEGEALAWEQAFDRNANRREKL